MRIRQNFFSLQAQQNKDLVGEAFELFDSDGDGHLLVSEVASAIRALGHVMTDTDIKNMLKKIGVEGFCIVCMLHKQNCYKKNHTEK